MNFLKRIGYRIIRELYRVTNKRYIRKYNVLAKDKPVFTTQITNTTVYSCAHIPTFQLPAHTQANDRTLIIHIPYGGLGDHIFYSHIPRLAKQTGTYSKVFFSSKSLVRNPIHLEYIWKRNPYLDGFCDEPNYHDYNSKAIAVFDETKGNILDQIMLSFGIDDGNRWHDPELYFEVPIIAELQGKSVYDPNFISYSGGLSSKKMETFFRGNHKQINYQFPVRSSLALPVTTVDSFVKDASFEEFCGILVSCNELFALTTGTATLAAALRKPTTVFHGNKIDTYFLHSKLHTYILI